MDAGGASVNHTMTPGPVCGVVRVPGSKSITHRAALLAALSETPVDLRGALDGADTHATRSAVQAMGANVDEWSFAPSALHAPGRIDVANSGTTMRLMMGQCARFAEPSTIDGDASIRRRPNQELVAALAGQGARIDGTHAPLCVHGPLRPGVFHLPAGVSSQFASSILLTTPFLEDSSQLMMEAPVASRPYIDLSLDVARAFGLEISDGLDIAPSTCRGPRTFDVEPDWSSAAFPLVAGAIAGDVTVEGLATASRQGDRAILALLESFGARVRGGRVQHAPLATPGIVDVAATPDLFPALCILAAAARGTTTFTGGAALRHKESDRITAMAEGFEQLGVACRQQPDGLVVTGGSLRGGTVAGHGDHRIHMAFCLAGLIAQGPVTVTDADSTAISYPAFHRDLAQLQGVP